MTWVRKHILWTQILFFTLVAHFQRAGSSQLFQLMPGSYYLTNTTSVSSMRSTIKCTVECTNSRQFKCAAFSYDTMHHTCLVSSQQPVYQEDAVMSHTKVYTIVVPPSCPGNWIENPVKGTCVLLVPDEMVTGNQAKSLCEEQGTQLMILDSEDSLDWFFELRNNSLTSMSSKEIWLGAKWDGSRYSWSNGATAGLQTSSTRWRKTRNEPNRSGDCVNSFPLSELYLLRDHNCDSYEAGYACETDKS